MKLPASAATRHTPTRPQPAVPARKFVRGFTLIELMVAITIGLFIVSGIGAILVSMRTSFKAQDGLTQMQENARFLLTVLDTTVHNGGYFTDTVNVKADTALPAPASSNADGTTFAAAQFITGTSGTSDTIDVRFQTATGDGLMNCNGDTNTSGANAVYTNSFAVNGSGQLTCAVATNGGLPAAAEILIDNVSTMKILYGVDTDGDGSVDTYKPASAITTTAMWNAVGSVQLTLTMKDLVNSTPTTSVNLPKTLMHTINLMNKR
jgi:type IV pilus assembly protein PilW